MKYVLLIYQNPATWEALPEEERTAVMNEATALMDDLVASGEWVDGQGLAHPSNAKTVRQRSGTPVVTDGPYAEAKEQLAGFCIFDCETPERALEIAERWPDARYDGVELRPLMDASGTEM